MKELDNLNTKIWVCNHLEDMELETESDKYAIYNLFESHDDKDNIDSYNKLLSEYVLQYYVSKNNIKSDIVGFCQYSKLIQYYDIFNLSKNKNKFVYVKHIRQQNNTFGADIIPKYSWIYTQINEFGGPSMLATDMVEYLNKQNIVNKTFIKEFSAKKIVPMIRYELYVIDWKGFLKLTDYINNYIEFIYTKYNINNLDDFKQHVFDNIIRYYQKYGKYLLLSGSFTKCCYQLPEKFNEIYNEETDYGYGKTNCWRVYAYCIEILIAIFLAYYICVECNNPTFFDKYVITSDN